MNTQPISNFKRFAIRMSAILLAAICVALLLAACSSPSSTSQPPAPTPQPCSVLDHEPTISQVKPGEITIDGDLAEWAAREWLAVSTSRLDLPLAPSPDLDVKVSFAFDTDKFYLAVRALDDDIQKVDRSWRYGDGFLFTLVTDEGKERSRYVYQYAFDQQSQALLFRDGEYLLLPVQDVEFKFQQHSDGMDYEVAIPFTLLKPFTPFTYEKAALNLIYTDRDSSGGVSSVMVYPDQNFDTEASSVRAGHFFLFQTAVPELAQEASVHTTLRKNFFLDGETIELRYAVNSDKSQEEMTIRAAVLSESTEKQQEETTLDLQPGLNAGTLPLTIGALPSGNYTLRVTFMNQNGNPASETTDDIFVLNQGVLEEYRKSVAAYKAQEALEASLSNLEIRFEWLDEFYKKPNYEDISALGDWQGDIVSLIARLEKGEPAVFDGNTIKRYAHRSKIDDTLQPYSVFLPESFNPGTQYPLIVFLHGSGTDERQLMSGLVSVFGTLEYPIIAPKARGLSSEYEGDSGEDVFECIEHFISLFPNVRRDRVFLAGFSMGGTGTWRLGILRPDYFRGLIILSGRLDPGTADRLRDQNIFIVHGAKDLAVPIGNTRKAVEKLQAMGANVVYIEFPEGGHGDYFTEDLVAQIIAWIRKYSD